MKTDDYQSPNKARTYAQQRFTGGRETISKDEIYLIKKWISDSVKIKRAIFLDLGAGTGRVTSELFYFQPQKIYALDSSVSMLDYLKAHLKTSQQKLLQTINAFSDKVPLKKEGVDVVIALHLFKHLNNPESTISEISRVLKKGGYFIFDVLNKNSLIQVRRGTCSVTSEKGIQELLNENGFKVIKISYMHFFGETIYGLLGKHMGKLLHPLDLFISKSNLKMGTKIFILAQKQ